MGSVETLGNVNPSLQFHSINSFLSVSDFIILLWQMAENFTVPKATHFYSSRGDVLDWKGLLLYIQVEMSGVVCDR